MSSTSIGQPYRNPNGDLQCDAVGHMGDACGVCRKPRRNFDAPPSQLSIYPGKSIDQDEDFYAEDWSMEALRDRVDLACAFDAACDDIRSNFIALLDDFDVVEETIQRPVKVKKLVARAV